VGFNTNSMLDHFINKRVNGELIDGF